MTARSLDKCFKARRMMIPNQDMQPALQLRFLTLISWARALSANGDQYVPGSRGSEHLELEESRGLLRYGQRLVKSGEVGLEPLTIPVDISNTGIWPNTVCLLTPSNEIDS